MSNAVLVAMLFGLVLAVLNALLFAGGHGIYVVCVSCFGPAFALGHLCQNYLLPLFFGPILYSVYAIALVYGHTFRRPLTALWFVLLFHNAFVAAYFGQFWSSDYPILQRLHATPGAYWVYLTVGLYALANILAILFSVRGERTRS